MISSVKPYILELTSKLLALCLTVILAATLSTENFGDYTYIRSFSLIASTLLLFGLQASSFKFSNKHYELNREFTAFSVAFILSASVAIYLIPSPVLFIVLKNSVQDYVGFTILLIISGMFNLFFIAYSKASGKLNYAYYFSTLNVVVTFSTISLIIIFGDASLTNILLALALINTTFCLTSICIMVKRSFIVIKREIDWPIKEWFSLSVNLWFAGFLPVFLLQGTMLFIGMSFDSLTVGYYAFALVIVSNLAFFKEVSIAKYLPVLISEYKFSSTLSLSKLSRCVCIGTLPIIFFTFFLMILEDCLLMLFSSKLDKTVFDFLYLLLISQVFMSFFQPIFRFMAATGQQKITLYISLILCALLLSSYSFFASEKQILCILWTTIAVSVLASLISIFILKSRYRIF